ncbi:MAG TPA: zf-HC2 domain-containing protein [Thermoanaerobaculia bacterium]
MNHPTDETLAAFADATLSDAERQEVMKHLAECADCLEAVMWTTEMKAVEEPVAGNVVSAPFGWKKIVPLAAAASLVIVLGLPQTRERLGFGPMRAVKTVVTGAPERPNEARISLDVPYKEAKPRLRGGNEENKALSAAQIEFEAAEAKQRAEKNPSVRNLHAAGVLLMFDQKYDEAIAKLELAVRTADEPSAALFNDLSAAYFGDDNYQKALEKADQAWKLEPTRTAAWNRAIALEFMHRYSDASTAWQKYLDMDPQSPWADEARDRMERTKALR